MLDYKIILKVDGATNQICGSEFIAINNYNTLANKYGKERITVERVKIPGKWCRLYEHLCSNVVSFTEECCVSADFNCDTCEYMYINKET